jgi:PTS system mannose-specific IIB component
MKNIVLTRIDERLLHGQVVVSWIPYLKADEVLIVDDEYANDDFMSLLIKNAAPDNVKVQVLDYLKATDYLNSHDKGTRILILLRSVEYVKKLIDSGIVLHKVNVGNLGSSPDREQYYNSVYLSNAELNLLKEIAKQSDVEIKMLPNDKSMTLV